MNTVCVIYDMDIKLFQKRKFRAHHSCIMLFTCSVQNACRGASLVNGKLDYSYQPAASDIIVQFYLFKQPKK
jgi:hypothetical protein